MGKSKLKVRSGFTIIEVLLVLGITGFLLSGLMVGVGSAIARQRYRDSVHDFAEFLRRTYSSVLTVQNPRKNFIGSDNYCGLSDDLPTGGFEKKTSPDGSSKHKDQSGLPGRTNCAYYGKLITFGEKDQGDKIFVYDVVGKDLNTDKLIDSIAGGKSDFIEKTSLDVLTLIPNQKNPTECSLEPFGPVANYTPQWQARIEKSTPGSAADSFKGNILLIHSPINGRIHTYYKEQVMEIQQVLAGGGSISKNCKDIAAAFKDDKYKPLKISTEFATNFKEPVGKTAGGTDDRISFCVGSNDTFAAGGVRRKIALNSVSGNTSSVEIVPQDSKDNTCAQ